MNVFKRLGSFLKDFFKAKDTSANFFKVDEPKREPITPLQQAQLKETQKVARQKKQKHKKKRGY